MAERFINLRQWEVRAFLAGRKTRVTRVVKPQPIGRQRVIEGLAHITKGMNPADDGAVWYVADGIGPGIEIRCSFGSPGDVLIGREKWRPSHVVGKVWYAEICGDETHERWRSASTMPRDASRIRLHVEAVRVQRVQEITEEEAAAEGARCEHGFSYCTQCLSTPTMIFAEQWNEDNKRHPWASSPWTWVGTVRMEVKP